MGGQSCEGTAVALEQSNGMLPPGRVVVVVLDVEVVVVVGCVVDVVVLVVLLVEVEVVVLVDVVVEVDVVVG